MVVCDRQFINGGIKMKSRVKISNGNSKLGKIPNISLPPIKACGNCEECKKECYALKFYRMYPSVRNAWSVNWNCYRNNPKEYWNAISEHIGKKKPRFFRWHVAGDIADQTYLDVMAQIAQSNPETTALVFTKMYNLDYSNLPDNLSVIISAWPGKEIHNPFNLPIAFMQDGTETRVENSIECPGNCEQCGMCFNLKDLGKNVVFYKH